MTLLFWICICSSLLLLAVAVEFNRRDKLSKSSFFFWTIIAFGLASFTLLTTWLPWIASLFGLSSPYAFTSTVAMLLLLFINLYGYTKIYENRRKLTQLSQEVALLEEEKEES